jgi:YD repeat-containing protein
VVITYIYDPLYRLTEANYSTGEFYHYTYDQVGNRLTEEAHLESHDYVYDVANRLSSVDTVSYTFDDNGNLLDDGVSTYTYDEANRLSAVSGPSSATYAYNGLGDRYQQTVDSETTTYVLDLNTGLTQVLDDGDNAYLYGLGRVAEIGSSTEYFMGDGLGSVRQLVEGDDIVGLQRRSVQI